MYQNLIVSVDHGNRNMKTENKIFTSGLTESETKPPLGDYLIYQKKFYTLTDQRIPYMRDKTLDDRFYILTLFAIAMEAEEMKLLDRNELLKVCLPVGLPPKHYGSLYQKFEVYFQRNAIESFVYKGKEIHVCIEDVMAFPQDYAAAMTIYPQIRQYAKAIVIDIGGFTLDYLLIRGGNADLSVCDSLENGVIKLYNNIISKINSDYDVLIEERDIDRILQEKGTDYPAYVSESIKKMTQSFVDDLLGSLRERGLDLKSGCVVFLGGGALLLRKYLENSKKIGNSLFLEDIRANAKGYGILYQLQRKAGSTYGKKE